jgi:hypothetical protein
MLIMVRRFTGFYNYLLSLFDGRNEIPRGDYIYVNSIIEMLNAEPEKWQARWYSDDVRLCKSIRCGDILIMCETGAIIHPVYPAMTRAQRRSLSRLAKAVVTGS